MVVRSGRDRVGSSSSSGRAGEEGVEGSSSSSREDSRGFREWGMGEAYGVMVGC